MQGIELFRCARTLEVFVGQIDWCYEEGMMKQKLFASWVLNWACHPQLVFEDLDAIDATVERKYTVDSISGDRSLR